MNQVKLADLPVDKEDAEEIAHKLIRETYGNLPSVGEAEQKEDTWEVPIHVKYPRISFDDKRDRPNKVRYMNLENLGSIRIDANEAVVVDRPNFYDLRGRINERLSFIKEQVQRALVKVGAEKFSKLPFSEHMHTPVQDIISYLLVNEKFETDIEFKKLTEEEVEKYENFIDILSEVGLVRRNGGMVLPSDALIEIEQQGGNMSDKMSHAMSYFFAQGYHNLDSIRRVLGTYLHISSYVYEQSFEYDEIMNVRYEEIERDVDRSYNMESKKFKLPRYLIQLEEVGLLEQDYEGGFRSWRPSKGVFSELQLQEDLLSPVEDMFIEAPA